ncbi:MAG: MarR family transcriptional regulator [Rhodoblastus sp.]|jgi:DNA-binding MarR family transcriptional regulator
MGKAAAAKGDGAKRRESGRREKPAALEVAADARSSPNALDLENYVPAFLTWIANKLSSSASLIYRRRFGIGIVEWRIMALLGVEPWITAGRICEVIGLDKAGVSRSVRFLLDKGLAETRYRDNNNRRQFIALTHAGIELHDRIAVVARAREEQLLTGFSDAERAAAVRLLARMHENLPLVRDELSNPDDA